MSKTTLKPAVNTPAISLESFTKLTLTGSKDAGPDHAIGAKLTELYRDAQAAELAILRFGAAFWAVEQRVVSACGHNSADGPKRGPGAYGFKNWLEDHAPEISRTTAIRYRDIAEATALKFKITDPVRVFSLPVEQLTPKDQTKREQVCEWMADKSQRAIQLELGLVDNPGSKGRGGYHPSEIAVQKWLEEHHKKQVGKPYAELSEELQLAFQQSGYNDREWRSPGEIDTENRLAAHEALRSPVVNLTQELDRTEWRQFVSPADLTALRRELQDAIAKVDLRISEMEGRS